ncbi:MAG: hypothetical protein WB511_10040 [Nitrososphaeraceae archaeon]
MNSQYRCEDDISPESKVIPIADMNMIQQRISGKKLPEILLELCDYCHWSLVYFNRRGIIERCPDCNKNISLIPMNIDEVCSIQYDDERGVTITFDRKKPMR